MFAGRPLKHENTRFFSKVSRYAVFKDERSVKQWGRVNIQQHFDGLRDGLFQKQHFFYKRNAVVGAVLGQKPSLQILHWPLDDKANITEVQAVSQFYIVYIATLLDSTNCNIRVGRKKPTKLYFKSLRRYLKIMRKNFFSMFLERKRGLHSAFFGLKLF